MARRTRLRRARALTGVAAVAAAAIVLPATPAAALEEPVVSRVIRDSRIVESSGLATSRQHRGVLWTHNDSGDGPHLFAIAVGGSTAATVTVAGAPARDWEAMAADRLPDGQDVLYVGDIGDNARQRSEVLVHRVVEPEELRDQELPALTYRFQYEDGPRDAEALLVRPSDGRIFVVSKESGGGDVYAAPADLSTTDLNVLRRVGPAPSAVTDGTFLRDGRVVLRTYRQLYVADDVTGFSTSSATASVDALPSQPQGESVTTGAWAGEVRIGSEGADSLVWRLPLP